VQAAEVRALGSMPNGFLLSFGLVRRPEVWFPSKQVTGRVRVGGDTPFEFIDMTAAVNVPGMLGVLILSVGLVEWAVLGGRPPAGFCWFSSEKMTDCVRLSGICKEAGVSSVERQSIRHNKRVNLQNCECEPAESSSKCGCV